MAFLHGLTTQVWKSVEQIIHSRATVKKSEQFKLAWMLQLLPVWTYGMGLQETTSEHVQYAATTVTIKPMSREYVS